MANDGGQQDSEDGPTQVIFSLIVNSDQAIPALSEFPGRLRPPRVDDNFHYVVRQSNFEESDWSKRADKLDDSIHQAVDRLEATGVDPEVLLRSDVFVRAYFTFGQGAETISAEAVQRLAEFHATIWIDTSG